MPSVHEALRTVGDMVPKPVVAFGLASCAWLGVCALWVGCVDTLSLLGF